MRRSARLLLLAVIYLFVDGFAYGRSAPPKFQHAFPNRFLPQNFVYSIAVDHRRMLWLGTLEGVGEWDGKEMKLFKASLTDSNSLPSNTVRRIFEDSHGWLWVHTSMGWAVLSPNRSTILRVKCPGEILEDRQKNVWCATKHFLESYNYQAKMFDRRGAIRLPVVPQSIWADRTGTFWLFGNDGNIYSFPPMGRVWEKDTPVPIHSHKLLSGFRIGPATYLLNVYKGTFEWHPGSSALEKPMASLSLLAHQNVVGHGVSPGGVVWIATRQNIYRYNPATSVCQKAMIDVPRQASAADLVFSICVGPQGIVWAGTIWGVYEYDPFQKGFDNITLTHEGERSDVMVLSIARDKEGKFWIGTYGKGLYEYDGISGKSTNLVEKMDGTATGLSSDVIWATGVDGDDRVWLGTDDGLDVLVNRRKHLFRSFYFGPQTSVPGLNTVTAFATDDSGRLWGATYTGKFFATDITKGYKLYKKFQPNEQVRSISFEGDSVIWFGTANGLLRFNRKSGATERFLQATNGRTTVVWSLEKVGGQIYYLGTGHGLFRLDYPRREVDFIGALTESLSSNVFGVLADQYGNLWCSTNRGIVRVSSLTSLSPQVRIYNHPEWLANLEFNRGAYFKSSDGVLYFGGNDGVTAIDPAEVWTPTQAPHCIIQSVTVTLPDSEYVVRYPVDTLEISSSNLTLSIHFIAPYWTDPGEITYDGKLVGVDQSWIKFKYQRSIQYTHLSPGSYVFIVRAVSPDGIPEQKGASLAIIVPPPFWDTLWFKLAAGIFCLGVLVSTVRAASVRKFKKRLLVVQLERDILDKERTRFSRDIHDEIGAGLTEIAILSELSRQDAEVPAVTSGQIGQVAELARSLVDKLSEIVWSINPQHDSLDHFVAYLHEYAHRYLENINISIRWKTPGDIPEMKMSSVVRRDLLLIFKEALANAVKHSDCHTLEIGFGFPEENMEMWLSDDGNGFENGHNLRHGLRNMCDRATEIGGTCKIESLHGKGTKVVIVVPMSKLATN